jgi:hypothetical protein
MLSIEMREVANEGIYEPIGENIWKPSAPSEFVPWRLFRATGLRHFSVACMRCSSLTLDGISTRLDP